MKNTLIPVLLLAGWLSSCGGDQSAVTAAAGAAPATPAATPAAAAALDPSTWQPTDLSKVSDIIPVVLAVPAGAKLEKNGNGGVDVMLTDKLLLTVSSQAVSTLQEARAADESYLLNNEMYLEAKKLVDEPTGFVYTRRMKTEENGTTYEPESHFVYYLEKNGSFFSIADDRTMDAISASGSSYPEAQAKALYEAVKKSAHVK